MSTRIESRRYFDESREDCESRILDHVYTLTGPCCAGCDWWQPVNTVIGECTRSAPVSGIERGDALGVTLPVCRLRAGHILTWREHRCGEFKDEFDWSTLPVLYLRRIGRNERGEVAA